jgi:molybdopterin biosynthesis enzyme
MQEWMTIVDAKPIQRIARLTPLADVLAMIDARVAAVAPRMCDVAAGLGRTLAQDVVASARPEAAISLRDGWAVEAAQLADAGPYAPVAFASFPSQVDVGDPLPPGTDTVAPLDAIHIHGERAEAIAPVAPGDGVLAAGADAVAGVALRRAGERVRSIDATVFAAAGVREVTMREPRIRVACGSTTRTAVIDAATAALARAIESAGGKSVDRAQTILENALNDINADAIIAVGGTGSGRHDGSVRALARLGRVEAHGIAVSPGETAAFGFVGARPVLLVPGRIDAALTIWLLIGRPLIAKLAGRSVEDTSAAHALTRKATSNLGLTELVPVRRSRDGVEPLASGYLPLTSLAHGDGWIVIPADSEGYPAGTAVTVRPWP